MKIAIGSRIVMLLIVLGPSLLAKPLLAQCQTGALGVTYSADILDSFKVDGDTLAISYINHAQPDYRRVNTFRREAEGWSLEAMLPAPQGNAIRGYPLALDGDVLAVGVVDDYLDTQQVFVYRRSGIVWTLEQVLESDMPSLSLGFGRTLALEGDTLVVGEYHSQTQARRVHVYLWNGVTWTREAVLSASDANDVDFFGSALALRGDKLIVAAETGVEGVGPGKVYVFQGGGSVWTETQQLFDADPIEFGRFGHDLAFDGTTLAVSARRSAEVDGLCVYTFIEQGGQWTQESRLTIHVPAPPQNWWNGLELSGDRMLVGNSLNSDAGPSAGNAIVFERTAGGWSEAERLYADDVSAGFHFGRTIAWAGGPAIVRGYVPGWGGRWYTFEFDDPNCPGAAFAATPVIGMAPLSVSFTDQSAGSVTSWEWSFGDGASAAEQHPGHVYSTPDRYTVSLTARGPSGSSREIAVDAIWAQTAASASVRNGSGVNDLCYASTSLPLLGDTWTAEVDASAHAGASMTFLLVYLRPRAPLPTPRGEILIDLTSARIAGVTAVPDGAGIARYSLPIPSDLALEGFALATQAGIFGSIELCNAVDLVLGF